VAARGPFGSLTARYPELLLDAVPGAGATGGEAASAAGGTP
jgi:hypothetical protein